MTQPKVVIVGSCNIDLISYVSLMPRPGETIHGSDFSHGFGGKGANQAVAASKLGAPTAIVARVGSDRFGDDYIESLRKNGVETKFVKRSPNAPTGVATIIVDQRGENTIVVVGGANMEVSPSDLGEAEDLIKSCDVLVCQGEIPEGATKAALALARKHSVTTIMNAAPASASIDDEIFALSDIFCVNESEASILTDRDVNTVEEAVEASGVLRDKGCREVVVSLGAKGAVYACEKTTKHVPARRVHDAVDTTGAGDCFVGALAYLLWAEPHLAREEMVGKACRVASDSVRRRGTQSSFPTKSQIDLMFSL